MQLEMLLTDYKYDVLLKLMRVILNYFPLIILEQKKIVE